MKNLLTFLILLSISISVHAQEINLIVGTTSWHSTEGFYTKDDNGEWSQESTPWNGKNTGIGIEYGLSNHFLLSVGYMKNSYHKNMVYGGLIYKSSFGKYLDLGIQGGLLKSDKTHSPGYNYGNLMPLVMPYVSLKYKTMAVNLIYEPGGILSDRDVHVFAIQWKLRLSQ